MRYPAILTSMLGAFGFVGIVRDESTETRAGGIDEYDIARVEQAVVVVDELVRRRRRMAVVTGDHTFGAECAHVQPHRR